MTPSYLVSTAGHAQDQNDRHPHDVRTVLQLITEGSTELGDEAVVGFTALTLGGQWRCDRYPFPQLHALSDQVAAGLMGSGLPPAPPGAPHDTPGSEVNVVSLLCPTGLDFLLAWMALMRLGYGVLFVAPQCSASAIEHLVHSTSSTLSDSSLPSTAPTRSTSSTSSTPSSAVDSRTSPRLIYHPKYTDLAQSAQRLSPSIDLIKLSSQEPSLPLPARSLDPSTISHVFHTSGTSGIPKPIPHTHAGSVTVLPRRSLPTHLTSDEEAAARSPSGSSRSESAAFTTTPLFHGGVSDLLRAWMARSMIYFYPTSDTPVTADHIVAAVTACNAPVPLFPGDDFSEAQAEERRRRFAVTAFLSVPYILTILSEDAAAMEMLVTMEFVSTGGAPLDTSVGDGMVRGGVRLVSRLGSSECGFLLSSHRDYANETDWEWLRNDSAYADALVFEPVDDTKCEMVVTDRWSSKTKANRTDGSYATGDLYERHLTKPNVWRYAGRGDDVIVMSNGEKASPGPIESVFRSSPIFFDALVVGSDRPQLGLLLFPSSAPSDLTDTLPALLARANQHSPSFARIAEDMCVVIADSAKDLPKSSKGSIQRGVAYEVFREEVDALYTSTSSSGNVEKQSLPEIEGVIRDIILGATNHRGMLDVGTDLFSWGVDSLMATRIRSGMIKNLNTGEKSLARNVVFGKPTIHRLAQHIFDLQQGHTGGSEDDPLLLMRDLAKKYGTFGSPGPPLRSGKATASGKTILLTGATGSLGSFLLEQLAAAPPDIVDRIVCLVRAEDDDAAVRRVAAGLQQRGLSVNRGRYDVYSADLTKPTLGLSAGLLDHLIRNMATVIHAAWPVHFTSSLVSYEDNIKGTRNLLDLVSEAEGASLFFCSSLASVLNRPVSTVFESPSDDPSTASPIGYSQSKWVTERVCLAAYEKLGGRVHVLRVGQLCGDTKSSHWNEKEGWPLLLRTAQTTGCLPELAEKPSWLPVDLAAKAIVEVITTDHDQRPFIYHISHPSSVDWSTVLDGMEAAGVEFQRVDRVQWLERVRASSDDPQVNPSKQMWHMWEAAYGGEERPQPTVDTAHARSASKTLREAGAVDPQQVVRMVEAWRRSGFLRQNRHA